MKLSKLTHLANLAYDPVNYEIFDQLNTIELFFDILYTYEVK